MLPLVVAVLQVLQVELLQVEERVGMGGKRL